VLLFSGGKDSMAAGELARRAGYRVHAVYVKRVNRAYPTEGDYAERIARLLGWDFTCITPEGLPAVWLESMVKNQYLWAVAQETLPFIPGAVAAGSHAYADVDNRWCFHDFACAFAAFEPAARAAWGEELRRLDPLRDEIEAYAIWRELPEEARALTASCMLPLRYKAGHRRRMLARGVPLLEYECGACDSCYTHALIMRDGYPAEYLDLARRKMRALLEDAREVYGHADLRTWAADTRNPTPGASSYEHMLTHVYRGELEPPALRRMPLRTSYPVTVVYSPGANEANGNAAVTSISIPAPRWIEGDSRELDTLLAGEDDVAYDFVLTCPPYYTLERYSDDPRDLSTSATYADFRAGYTQIIQGALSRLKPDRFAAVVVGSARDADGFVVPLAQDTIAAAAEAGARLYNEATLILPAGSLPIRAAHPFLSARKLGRSHNTVLIFCTGDPKRAALACGGASVEDAIALDDGNDFDDLGDDDPITDETGDEVALDDDAGVW
jgi:hypothetical protein